MGEQPVTRETDKNRLKQPVKSERERERERHTHTHTQRQRHGERRREEAETETEICDGGLQTHLPVRNDIY